MSLPKKKVLVVSHVVPLKLSGGNELRVNYILKALNETAEVTFLTFCKRKDREKIKSGMAGVCKDFIFLDSVYNSSFIGKIFYKTCAYIYSLLTGLKESNYIIGNIEFTPIRIKEAIINRNFDYVFFEYFHAYKAAGILKKEGIHTVLDMHNILWQSYMRQKVLNAGILKPFKNIQLARYKKAEENSWRSFNTLIAINQSEYNYVKTLSTENMGIKYMPMGIDISKWEYSWQESEKKILAYYGSMGSTHNAQDALECAEVIMPKVWQKYPEAELMLIGNNPPDFIRELADKDKRITVTGFVKDVKNELNKAVIILCPWKGTYGFRSRIVEVMALGLPVVTTHQAVDGMEMQNGNGIFMTDNTEAMVSPLLNLLENPEMMKQQSLAARKVAQEKYNYEVTYLRAIKEILH